MPPNDGGGLVVVATRRVDFSDDGVRSETRPLAVETPVNIVYAPLPFAVMMATPRDLEDFAYGFSFTESVIATADDIRSIEIEEEARGLKLVVTLASSPLQSHLARSRSIAGRTGCGVCGIDDLAALPLATRRVKRVDPPARGAIHKALSALRDQQPLNAETAAVHAAAWCAMNGDILAVREDVGRHNALDKLIGHLLRDGAQPEEGFIVITSRCSFEMVEKAAAFGVATLVAISAPTALAVERASLHGMTLVALARDDSALIFGDISFAAVETAP